MNDVDYDSVRFASGLIIMLAVWQIFSPLILGYAGNAVALWDAINVGLPVLALSLFRILRPERSAIPTWINLVLGAWLAVSPFALGITAVHTAMANDITLGISIAFFALVGLALSPRITRT